MSFWFKSKKSKKSDNDQKKQEKPKYYVRFAEQSDIDRIVDFYSGNKHHNVRERDRVVMEKLAKTGSITFIEDEGGKIVASSITYPLKADNDGAEKQKWLEIGTTRIVMNGYPGFFDVLVSTQVLRAMLVEPPEDCFVAHMEHQVIQDKACKLGWRKFSPSEELKDVSNRTIDKKDLPDRSDNWYHYRAEGLPVTAKYLVDVMKNPVLKHAKTGEEIEVSFERVKNLMLFKNAVEELAEQDYGSMDKPDTSRGMREHRDKWLKKFGR